MAEVCIIAYDFASLLGWGVALTAVWLRLIPIYRSYSPSGCMARGRSPAHRSAHPWVSSLGITRVLGNPRARHLLSIAHQRSRQVFSEAEIAE
jgi:hypothetical protein